VIRSASAYRGSSTKALGVHNYLLGTVPVLL
jgi:hypothetical protein